MPRVVIDLDTERASSYCGSLCQWVRSFPGCRSCSCCKGGGGDREGGTFRYYRHSSSQDQQGSSRQGQSSVPPIVVEVRSNSIPPPPPYTPSPSSEQEINFELATVPQFADQQQQQQQQFGAEQQPNGALGNTVAVPAGLRQQSTESTRGQHHVNNHDRPEPEGQALASWPTVQNGAEVSGGSNAGVNFDAVEASPAESPPISVSDLVLQSLLGRGHFGPVMSGVVPLAADRDDEVAVVAQLLLADAGAAAALDFTRQARAHGLAAGVACGGVNVLHLLASATVDDDGAAASPLRSLPGLPDAFAATVSAVNVFQSCPGGNLKLFLRERAGEITLLKDSGLLLKFCAEIARGTAALHEVGFVPSDLALRCCQLSQDLTVKVGDYGLAPAAFLDEYVPVNGDPQPVRWMPPEILDVIDSSRGGMDSDSSCSSSTASGGQNFLQEQQHNESKATAAEAQVILEGLSAAATAILLSDASFVSVATTQPLTLSTQLGPIAVKGVEAEAVQSVANLCLKVDPNSRPDCSRVEAYLTELFEAKMEEETALPHERDNDEGGEDDVDGDQGAANDKMEEAKEEGREAEG